MSNVPYPYVIEPNKPVWVSPLVRISRVNKLMRAILLNRNIKPFLHLVNTIIDGWTPLMIVARNSNTWSTENTVKTLIDCGAELDWVNQDGQTALMLAVINSHFGSTESSVKMLIDAGANCNLQDETPARRSIVMLAAMCSSKNIVKMLIDSGVNIDYQDAYGDTVLMQSLRRVDILKILIDSGASFNLKNQEENTVLTRVIILYYATSKIVPAVKTLIDSYVPCIDSIPIIY